MALANYTTEVPAEKSAGEIQGMLAAAKARQILFGYDDDGNIESISFIINTPQGNIPFHLPANISKVEQVLINQRSRKPETWRADYESTMKRIRAQARRVGWRILRDWVRAQMAIIETDMVTMEQVFLPYMNVSGNRTLYEVMQEKHFMLTSGEGGR